MKRVAILMGVWLLLVQPAYSQLSMTVRGQPVTITFDSTLTNVNLGAFTGAGIQLNPSINGRLTSKTFAINGFSTNVDFLGAGATTGVLAKGTMATPSDVVGVYAGTEKINNVTNQFLLLQGDGTTNGLNPGYVGVKIQNNLTTGIIGFDLSYDIKYRNDKDTSDSLKFSYSSDNITYTDISSLDFATPTTSDSNTGFTTITRTTTIYASIAAGNTYFLRFNFARVSGTGASDDIGLDNITVTALPEPSTYALMTLGLMSIGYYTHFMKRRRSQTKLSI